MSSDSERHELHRSFGLLQATAMNMSNMVGVVAGGLDFVVDPAGQRLIGNPEHGGEQRIEMF